jgi:hypothetical protein
MRSDKVRTIRQAAVGSKATGFGLGSDAEGVGLPVGVGAVVAGDLAGSELRTGAAASPCDAIHALNPAAAAAMTTQVIARLSRLDQDGMVTGPRTPPDPRTALCCR